MKGFKFMRRMGKLRNSEETSAGSGAAGQQGNSTASETRVFQPETKPRRLRRSWIVATAGLVLLTTFLVGAEKKHVAANTVTYYKVLVKGEEIGTLSQDSDLNKLFEAKRREYQLKYPDSVMVLQTSGITTEVAEAYKPEIDSEATLDKLDGMLKAYAVGVELTVDGKPLGIVKDQETAAAVLEAVKAHYTPQAAAAGAKLMKTAAKTTAAAPAKADQVESAAIREEVSIVPVKADPNKVLSVEEAVKVLTEGKEEPLVYSVQEGDTVSAIASRFQITQADIFRNNPAVKELSLQIGDQLQLTVPQPDLTVVTVEQVTEQVVTEPEVIVRKSDQLAAGKRKVVRAGQTGLKTMQYRLTKENGLVVKEEWLGQTVVKASLPEVVYSGTKVVGEGTGMFAWPVTGATISSSYGERWGRAHKGLDIVSGNRTIKAADAGTVSFAGVQSGYGNVVIVNHNNGYVTYYGHLSRISVSVGQKLGQGSQIGIMGNTGRSTGTHLHFEIRKNGTAVNPMKYLK
ncbi:peptidoglycan DD-metalloendopeptidase family protein [Paenibacillus sp. LMG 31459]|uniref:Peptidoglycan DD-metalloendopeptidase family protein n=1 Tax=Paenibacillus phytohabitans TaxID=2654978 RepID=A0ABX1YG64_9BACL|nr:MULTISPECIES: M23 family metallopeptidase [Paenibacillus]AIQ33151.1 membrane protein [Paenibacillus sp. FSL P4-0081]NOU79997.1 peptidoglycan DD-metalloendopeptidase family protein [Paenibacillus phytohabitans]